LLLAAVLEVTPGMVVEVVVVTVMAVGGLKRVVPEEVED
jgi:hypothetical protein